MDRGANINATTSSRGHTVLSQVAEFASECSAEVVMELLNREADPLIGFQDGRSALQVVIRGNSYEILYMFSDFIVPGASPCGDPGRLAHLLPEQEPGPPEDEWEQRTWWDMLFVVRSLKRCASRAAYLFPP